MSPIGLAMAWFYFVGCDVCVEEVMAGTAEYWIRTTDGEWHVGWLKRRSV